jgi:hypothetical protein
MNSSNAFVSKKYHPLETWLLPTLLLLQMLPLPLQMLPLKMHPRAQRVQMLLRLPLLLLAAASFPA